ncbi:GlxA family transcriptional regulator [Actinomadura rugatobispora]|uniref:GlxA family transcriptional regulator n=1 Tax=Actinomadura rugatobispora TaxID=1994 RepID=A0ABW1A9L3_9ACTN|nr:helix-turn-helix domain-containing protein [Actinomadura rugatobispora]
MLFDGALLASMSFAFGVFDLASHYGALPGAEVAVVAGEPGSTLTGGGLTCAVPYDLQAVRVADLVVVPNLPQPSAEDPPEPALEALRAAHGRGARVAGLCSGTFVLAAAGLLDGRPATTHWALADRLAEMYPRVRVDASALYIDDGDVLTAGGGAAGIDVGLHLVRTMMGASAANRMARAMVVAPHRPGGQAQFIETPVPDGDTDDPVVETIAWAHTRLDTALPVSLLAERAHMSRRNYDRRFREITGAAPGRWLTHQRVIRAQQLLELSDLPVDEIARSCGFSSAAALRPHFRRLLGVTMTDYRNTFSHRLS